MRIALIALTLLATDVVVQAKQSAITPATMTSWKIVCAPTASESERYAATEFQKLFQGNLR